MQVDIALFSSARPAPAEPNNAPVSEKRRRKYVKRRQMFENSFAPKFIGMCK